TLVRAGVRRILEGEPGFDVHEVADGHAALAMLRERPIDVLVLDLTMPGVDGFEVLRRVRAGHPAVKVLVLTMHASAEYVSRAIREGASGYLLKDSAVQDLMSGIRAVMAGRPYYRPPVQHEIASTARGGGRRSEPITDREREVLRLVAEGLSTKEVAARLDISARTVESHRANLMRKLGLHSVARLT